MRELLEAWDNAHREAGLSVGAAIPITPELSKAINRVVATHGRVREEVPG